MTISLYRSRTGAAPAANEASSRGLAYKWVVLINTTVAMMMAAVDSSIVTIALPDMTRSLNASAVEAMWVVMGYTLVLTASLLPMSRLSDMKGRVRMYNIAFAVFTGASALCGLAQSGTQLILFRLIQGIGAATLAANSAALVTDAFPVSERGLALSINQVAGLAGFILGIVLGGVITQFFGWRYIFFINIPIGVFATTWAFLKLRDIVPPERKAQFDIGGMVTFPSGIAAILGALTLAVMGRTGDPLAPGLFLAGIIMLVAFVIVERRAAQPMMDLSLFRIRLFWAGNASQFLSALARGGLIFIMSWYFQAVLNDSPLIAGLKILPLAVTMMVVAPIAGRLSDSIGSRWLSTAGLAFILVAQVWMISFSVSVSYLLLALALAIVGLGNGLFNTPNISAIMGSVPANRRGVAAGTTNMMFYIGQTMAIALTMAVLSTVMSYHLLTALFVGTAAGGQTLDSLAFMHGLHEVFFFGAIVTGIAMVFSSLRGN